MHPGEVTNGLAFGHDNYWREAKDAHCVSTVGGPQIPA